MEATRTGKAETESSVRFSFSELTTTEEIDYALEVLREVLPQLRRFTRK
jgi:cysteine desulfurase